VFVFLFKILDFYQSVGWKVVNARPLLSWVSTKLTKYN